MIFTNINTVSVGKYIISSFKDNEGYFGYNLQEKCNEKVFDLASVFGFIGEEGKQDFIKEIMYDFSHEGMTIEMANQLLP